MYDKVKLLVWRDHSTPDITTYLEGAEDVTDRATGKIKYVKGRIGNMAVRCYGWGFTFLGSLAKYLYPNNLYTLDRHSTAEAIAKMSDTLHIDMSAAKVTYLEFGKQFVVSHPVEDYLNRLGDLPYLKRLRLELGTLYYRQAGKRQNKEIAFYDKLADALTKGMALPPKFEEMNLLKYELRMKSPVIKKLGGDVTASTLSDKEFYRVLMRRYQAVYRSITKLPPPCYGLPDGGIRTVGDVCEFLFSCLLASQGGSDLVDDFLGKLRAAKFFDNRTYYQRLKKKLVDTMRKYPPQGGDDLIDELDNEILNVGAYV